MVIQRDQDNVITFFEERAAIILYKFLLAFRGQISQPFLLPINICPIVPTVFRLAGVDTAFADIEDGNLCISRKEIISMVKSKTISGFLFNHSFGLEEDFEDFFVETKKHNPHIIIIDDRCLCAPCFEASHTVAELVLYSTGYAKYVELNRFGYGFSGTFKGKIAEEYASISLEPTMFGECLIKEDSFEEYQKEVEAKNKEVLMHKRKLNGLYADLLPLSSQLGEKFNNWRFNIKAKSPAKLIEKIFAAGYFASTHFQPLLEDSRFEVANKHANEILNLFNDFHFKEEQAKSVSIIIMENADDLL
jgi:hypothetical protein